MQWPWTCLWLPQSCWHSLTLWHREQSDPMWSFMRLSWRPMLAWMDSGPKHRGLQALNVVLQEPRFFGGSFWYSRKMEMYRSTAWNHICGDIMIYPIISGAHRTRSDIMKLRLVSLYISSYVIHVHWFIRTHTKQNITCGVIRLFSWIERTALRRMMMKRSGQIQMVRTSGNEHFLMQGAGYAHSSMN